MSNLTEFLFEKSTPELRNKVYTNPLVSSTEVHLSPGRYVPGFHIYTTTPSNWRVHPPDLPGEEEFRFNLAILSTKKAIRAEAQVVFYAQNQFSIPGSIRDLHTFLARLKASNRRTLRYLRFSYTIECKWEVPWAKRAFELLDRCDNLQEVKIMVTRKTLYASSGGLKVAMGAKGLRDALEHFDPKVFSVSVENGRWDLGKNEVWVEQNDLDRDQVEKFEKMLRDHVGRKLK